MDRDLISETSPKLRVQPLTTNFSFRNQAYLVLKQAITEMNIYDHADEIRLDERQLSQDLGVSRTPIREAMTLLEQEGFVRTVPRRGIFVVRKTKSEIIEMITVWAALESMAARLITLRAGDEEIAGLRRMFATFEDEQVEANIDEYSEANVAFHQAILKMGHCELLHQLAQNLFIHMRAIRMRTIAEDDRAKRSIKDHMHIIEALEARDTDLAERLVRQHALDLAEHVKSHIHDLD